MATSPFSKELRDEETRSGFEVSDADETFELERLDGRPASIQQEVISAPAETVPLMAAIPPPPVIEVPVAAPLPTPEAIDTIDRELLAMLEAELAGSRQTTSKPTTLEAVAPPPAPFVDFDDVEQASAFDFSEINAQHPSEYLVQKETPPPSQESENMGGYAGYAAMAGNAYSEPVPEQIEQKETKKDRRSRRAIYMAAAGILLAFGVGTAVYFFWPNIMHLAGLTGGKDSTAVAESAGHVESMKQGADSHTEEKTHTEQQKPPEAHAEHKDVASADSHAEQEAHPAVQPKTEPETAHHQKEVKSVAAATPHEIVQKQTPAITKPVEATEQHPIKKKVTAHTESTIAETPPKPEPKKIAENEEPTPPKVRETVSSKIGKNTAKQKGKPEATQTESTGSGSETQVYTVQVYSTPSKDDAEEWLDQLRSKQIAGGFVSNQTVRGQTWYRVRFGSYSSREEAENAARRNGFSKSWIDRIK